MTTDVIARLAAANPYPHEAPVAQRRSPRRRLAVALVAAVVIVAPAAAFGGKLGDVLGFTNGGTAVSTAGVLAGHDLLDKAMQQLKVGSTMQYLGTLDGVAFYATRNADGNFCLAIDHVNAQYDKGFGCDLNTDGFPSADVQALTFPALRQLQGVAADGVATVQALDATGSVLDSAPVTNNLFVSDKQLPDGAVAAIRTLDANGDVTSTRQLP
jgi:hypothetical protein